MKSQTTKPVAATVFNGDWCVQSSGWEIVDSHKMTRIKLIYLGSTPAISLSFDLLSHCTQRTSKGITAGSPFDNDKFPQINS